ncbi:hypothetical protein [Trichlorobacter lovleyi]|uniref:hypothetical protein n=1 Tax=Trichlorobacter lovleyi TaxID=313985 RepID=UPI00248190DC|nr:hypothetical protein [Trichlorobacter lovleyi]
MDRQTSLTTMLQGRIASVVLPKRITSLLKPSNVASCLVDNNLPQNMRISAIGLGAFGLSCTQILTRSAHKIPCYQLDSTQLQHYTTDISDVMSVYPETDLLFLFADTQLELSVNILKAHLDSASGIQTVVICPSQPTQQLLNIFATSNTLYCAESDPITACQLVTTVSDFANHASFDGIDATDVKGYVTGILQKGNRSFFATSCATGLDRGSLASQSVLDQLEKLVSDSDIYSGAIACIYCNHDSYASDFDQAIVELFRFFLPNSTNKFNIIYNYVIDNSLHDAARVAVLAIV